MKGGRHRRLGALAIDPADSKVLYAATWQHHRTVAAVIDGGPETGIYGTSDGGANWSTAVRLNDDPIGNGIDQWQPQISVAPNGRIDVVWIESVTGDVVEDGYAVVRTTTDIGAVFALASVVDNLTGDPVALIRRGLHKALASLSRSRHPRLAGGVVVLGGMGSIIGVIIAALVLILMPEYLRAFSEYRMLMFGAVMVLMMIFRPQGLISNIRQKYEYKGNGLKEETENG